MNRAEWYVLLYHRGSTSTTEIEGIRFADKLITGGMIVPGLWFRDVSDGDFENIFINGYNAIEAYTPSAEELPILYSLYPAMMPKGLKPAVNGALSLKNKWYKVAQHSQVVWGVAALCTVKGVCKAGDVAFAGDIVPSQWFAGLSKDQLNRMERMGARSSIWFDAQEAEYRAKNGFKAPIERYAPNPIELLKLYEKFAGAAPNAELPAIDIVDASANEEATEGGE